MKVKIYIEGGGHTRNQQAPLRRAFRIFLEKAGLKGSMPEIVCCGGRSAAYDDFRTAVESKRSRKVPILLVDSEDLVHHPVGNAWDHLAKRKGDGWKKPGGVQDEQAHMMVCVMETWFLADREGLSRYFGKGFNANKLPSGKKIEEIPKHRVLDGLANATANTSRGTYNKNRRTFDILAHIDPSLLEKESPWAAFFLEKLRKYLTRGH